MVDEPSDRAAIAAHQAQIEHLLVPMVARYEFGELTATPEARELLAAPPELRASVAIAALAGPSSGWTAAHVAEVPWSDQWPAELVRALVRRKIAWTPQSAALALRLVAATDFDDERVQLVLKAADQIAETTPANPEVIDGLDRLQARLQETSTHRYRVPEMHARVIAAIARHSPPDLLDLSPVAESDCWGPAARRVLRDANDQGVDVASVLRCLTSAPATSEPSARWLASCDELLEDEGARRTVTMLVRLLVDLELDDGRAFVEVGNDALAKAAVWLLGHGSDPEVDTELLARVGIRCSQTSGKPYETAALSGKVAGAAVSVLARLRDEDGSGRRAAEAALDELWREVDRGDVLRRIGRAVGLSPEEITERIQYAKRSKAATKSKRIDPQPDVRKRLLGEVIETDVSERLRRIGFDDRSRRTFRRHHDDRTEVLTVSLAAAEVRLSFGVGFVSGSNPGVAQPAWRIEDLDVAAELWLISTERPDTGEISWLSHQATRHQDQMARRSARGEVDPVETLARLLDRFDELAIPALDRWSDPELLANDLEDLEVPFRHGLLLLGLDAPFGVERPRTVKHLRTLL